MEFKECKGWHGRCYHSDDMIVPLHEFGKSDNHEDGLYPICKSCKREDNEVSNSMMPRHPDWPHQRKCNWKTDYATRLYGGKPEFRKDNPHWNECMAKAEESSKLINWIILEDNVIQLPKREPTFANKVEWKTTTSRTRVRDQRVVKDIQGQYEECCIVGCHYQHYDVAHIWALMHDAPDLPTNCWPMCPNHHREFDKGRLDPIFGDELGNIKLVHEIDFENVTKALVALNEENSSQQGVK